MNIVAKLLGTLASLLTGWVGSKIVGALWQKTTGEHPPSVTNPEKQQQATLGKVLVFAVISGASAACIQALTKRWTRGLERRVAKH
ncbi:DUF4235 domain-containing protein [Arthrobacter sp. MYb213]|uniref:DUF4235 domain-containing protein n=1 Tax=Arthrobacter sp. MYb213 TaxID=1848595 RepID=UPI000CFB5FFD|nr:DUF4235 domain-containing protein [Arthrobacter sp. MYb213]PRB72646.1 hypothetical protein CQ011_03125 [Arthrobacter sp. MYb213]